MNICLVGMDERTTKAILLVFKHRSEDVVIVSHEDEADTIIFDIDHETSFAACRSIQARLPNIPIIGLSSKLGLELDRVRILLKPITANQLLDAVGSVAGIKLKKPKITTAEIATALGNRSNGPRRVVQKVTSGDQGDSPFNPNHYLLGTIMAASVEAGKKKQVAVISFYSDRVVLIDSATQQVHTNLSFSQLRAFSNSSLESETDGGWMHLGRPKVTYVECVEANSKYLKNCQSLPQELFMWMLGAMTSKGRLHADTSATDRVYLRRWPNMTRVKYSDNEMRIVAYWIKQAASLREISNALDISESEVFSVYSAAFAAGIAGKCRREIDTIWAAPTVERHQDRSIFSSIIRRLTQRKPAAEMKRSVAK